MIKSLWRGVFNFHIGGKMSDFGIFAKDLTLRAYRPPEKYGKIMKVPCTTGFKQRDNTYVNEFFDLIVFDDGFKDVEGIVKGDKLQVIGKVQLSEWTTKDGEKRKQWSILASDIYNPKNDPRQNEQQAPLGDVPF
jgi:hypothetical protein